MLRGWRIDNFVRIGGIGGHLFQDGLNILPEVGMAARQAGHLCQVESGVRALSTLAAWPRIVGASFGLAETRPGIHSLYGRGSRGGVPAVGEWIHGDVGQGQRHRQVRYVKRAVYPIAVARELAIVGIL